MAARRDTAVERGTALRGATKVQLSAVSAARAKKPKQRKRAMTGEMLRFQTFYER